MDMAIDLGQILLLVFGTVGGIMLLVFLLAALDPQSDRRRPAQPKVIRARSQR